MDGELLTGLFRQDPWVATATVALLAVVAALVAHRVGRALLGRATRGSPVLQAILRATESAAAAALPLAALQLVWTGAPDNLRYIQGVRHVNGLLLIAALTWLVMGVISGVAQGIIARHPVSVPRTTCRPGASTPRPRCCRAPPCWWLRWPAPRWR